MENALLSIYKNSWICAYFNVKPIAEEGVVLFRDNTPANRQFRSPRFRTRLNVPEITKFYFKPDNFWSSVDYTSIINVNYILAKNLSNVTHGIPSNTSPGTRVKMYDPPFFLFFKIPGACSNYLAFTDYQKPNSESSLLALLRYDEEKSMLKNEHAIEMILPYKQDLCLSEVLEFTLYDANNKLVKVSDTSQLFILLTIL